MGMLGMRQVDLVVDGETTMLTPVDGTAEAWRLQLERERPAISRLIGAVSWTVLVVALIYEVPQLIALIGGVVGADYEPPFMLPGVPTSCSASPRSRPPWSELCDSRAIAGSARRCPPGDPQPVRAVDPRCGSSRIRVEVRWARSQD